MSEDPDGISFFTEGRYEGVDAGSAGSVFGVVGAADLDRMFAIDGQEELGISVLPEDTAVLISGSPPLRAPVGLVDRGSSGDWRRDFILYGPLSEVVGMPRPSRFNLKSMVGHFRRKSAVDVTS